jgi:hypothetical protein
VGAVAFMNKKRNENRGQFPIKKKDAMKIMDYNINIKKMQPTKISGPSVAALPGQTKTLLS